ncbi:hypothetical protein HU720_05400 [Pseudomonas sp. SWRI51]|uniref:hypothetical protein n=1 Tax=Pseudomonas sp. SWRI51 TaxID=2745491 RepID=UPI00164575BF|nr:hypothetical protein [Pseudomonas sp. SWRI51]MBC3410733.1 hypothetical protein [Pseudomonas sp. SWRI51]
MGTKVFGEAFIWSGASQLQGGYYPILSVQRGEERPAYAVLREASYPTLEEAHRVAMDVVEQVEFVNDQNVITLKGGQTLQAA